MDDTEITNFTAHQFKAVMGHFATGVTVLTTRLGAVRMGLTVNAFCSLSLDPPLVLVCIDRASRVHDLLLQAGIFAVNFLTAEQEAVSRCFASHSDRRWQDFCGCPTHTAVTGAPILDESLGFVDCQILDVFPGGDHSIVVGRVAALGADEGDPLLYLRARYGIPAPTAERSEP